MRVLLIIAGLSLSGCQAIKQNFVIELTKRCKSIVITETSTDLKGCRRGGINVR